MHRAKSERKTKEPRKTLAVATKTLAGLGAACVALSGSLAHADVGPNHVRDVRVRALQDAAEATEVEIVGTSSPDYTVRVGEGGRRLTIDLSNADIMGAPAVITEAMGVVDGVLAQAFKTNSVRFARLSISLGKAATYRVKTDGNSLRVILLPQGAKVGNPGSLPDAAPTTPAPPSAATPTPAPTANAGSTSVKDVKFDRVPGACNGNACDRVVVSLSGIPSYALTTSPEGRARLELKDTALPTSLQRMLDVSAYRGPLKTIGAFADAARSATYIEIDRGEGPTGNVSVEGSTLVWTFVGPKVAKDSHKSVTVARDFDPNLPKVETSIHPDEETAGGAEAGFTSVVNGQIRNRYTGRRIELDVKDADIHNVLRFIADVGHVNIVTADDVQGNITIRMRNVPWDQALDVILQAKGLGMVRNGNLVRVAPAAVLQKERELAAAKAKSEFEQTPLETRLVPVNYAHAEDLQARAKDMLSPRGSMAVDDRTNYLIVHDIPANIDHIEQLVRSLDLQTPQVLVEARIVEATSKYLRDVGIQWGGDSIFSAATGNPTGLSFPSLVTTAGGNYDNNTPTAGLSPFQRQVTTPNFAVNLPAAVGTGAGGAIGFSLGSIDNTLNLGVRLSAAESSGLIRIVSSPRIMTLDNQEARINQGTLIPFAQVSALGVQTTFQEAKLQLLVKPHVTADGAVTMHVKLSRDEPDFTQTSPRGDPTILKREAETNLLVMDGHTAVIGGIYTRNTGRNLDQVPLLGDIPILGVLFQRRRASDARGELVIFLTPRIVNRAESNIGGR